MSQIGQPASSSAAAQQTTATASWASTTHSDLRLLLGAEELEQHRRRHAVLALDVGQVAITTNLISTIS